MPGVIGRRLEMRDIDVSRLAYIGTQSLSWTLMLLTTTTLLVSLQVTKLAALKVTMPDYSTEFCVWWRS